MLYLVLLKLCKMQIGGCESFLAMSRHAIRQSFCYSEAVAPTSFSEQLFPSNQRKTDIQELDHH